MNSAGFPSFFKSYVELIPEGDQLELLAWSQQELYKSLAMVSEEQANTSYAEGKWSIKDLVQHLMDTERILSYRALSFSRGEQKDLLGFDHDDYVIQAKGNNRSLKSLLEEAQILRKSTIALFASFSEEMLEMGGKANGLPLKVVQFRSIILGHEMHHHKIMNERYL